MKRQIELPRFVVGALATAGASMANAATVQITFSGSFISSTLGNNLDVDYGDTGTINLGGEVFSSGAGVRVNEFGANALLAEAFGYSGYLVAAARASVSGLGTLEFDPIYASVVYQAFATITFQDPNINSGAPTTGYLDITASTNFPGEKRITVNRLIFDDATGGTIGGVSVNDPAFPEFGAVPEPSSLGLLALGAGGLLARRRRLQAAA